MLFRDASGKLVEIRRYAFTNDCAYYKSILGLKTQTLNVYDIMQAHTHLDTQLHVAETPTSNRT